MFRDKRPLVPASRTWDPATGEYMDEDLPTDVLLLMCGAPPAKMARTVRAKEEETHKVAKKAGKVHGAPTMKQLDTSAPSVEYNGFAKVELNDTYYEMKDFPVNGKPTHWSSDVQFFIYWQATAKRWSICDVTSLHLAKKGKNPGWAYKSGNQYLCCSKGWVEAFDGQWREPLVEAIYRTSSEHSAAWENKNMQAMVNVIEFDGFTMSELNTKYFLFESEEIQGKPSYWDTSGVYFIYWQAPMKRWAVCDLKCYDAVKQGNCPGWAYRKDSLHLANACGWMERNEEEWTDAEIQTAVISTSAPSTVKAEC